MAELKIERIGRQGDGIAVDQRGHEQYVPFALPGETVSVSGKGTEVRVIDPAQDRKKPVCSHFQTCGGCQTQHFPDALYDNWKTGILLDALRREGIQTEITSFNKFDVADRRKAVFSIQRTDGNLKVGFAQSRSNNVIDIYMCPVLVPELEQALPAIKEFCASLPVGKNPARLSVLSTANGLDVAIDGMRPPAENQKLGLIRKAGELDFARLSFEDEVLVEARRPFLQMGSARVLVPPGGFVQASHKAEELMASLVTQHLERCKSVADLFSGVGTFALRLAEKSKVWALEENAAAMEMLLKGWRETGGSLKEVKAEARNLERRPATFQELKKFDGLVFDPPRSGAELQSRQIAKSTVRKVAAVSCNPNTFARDISILLKAGYVLNSLHAIDQFRFTPHLEIIGLLEK